MTQGLSDYLDGYEDFLDAHDRRTLGLTPAGPLPSAAPFAPTYRAMYQPTQPSLIAPVSPEQRLRSALIPQGRAVAVPFGRSAPSVLSPGFAPTGSPAAMPMSPVVMAPAPTLNPTSYLPSSVPTSTDPGPPPAWAPTWTPDGGQASGSSGLVSKSVWGWGLMILGAAWMYKNL